MPRFKKNHEPIWRKAGRYERRLKTTAEYRDDDDSPARRIPVTAVIKLSHGGDMKLAYTLSILGQINGHERELSLLNNDSTFSKLHLAQQAAAENIDSGFVGYEE